MRCDEVGVVLLAFPLELSDFKTVVQKSYGGGLNSFGLAP